MTRPLLRSGLALTTILLLLLAAKEESVACTYYAAPEVPPPSDPPGLATNLGTEADPFLVSTFLLNHAMPGSTLCLKDGTYLGAASMIDPINETGGTPSRPITIRALNEGQVLVDGESARTPVVLKENHYYTIIGINVAHSNKAVVTMGADEGDTVDGVVLKRVVAWDANPNINAHVISIARARNVLLEDIAAFGTGRKVVQVYESVGVTIRRGWARHDGTHWSGNQFSFSCSYRSYRTICENLIATAVPGHSVTALIGSDWLAEEDAWATTSDPWNAETQVLGSIAMGDSLGIGVHFSAFRGIHLVDVVSHRADPAIRPLSLTNCVANRSEPCMEEPYVIPEDAPFNSGEHITEIGSYDISRVSSDWVFTDWIQSNPRAVPPDPAPEIYKSTAGARICERYVDGVLTRTPLFPWVMNARIQAATAAEEGLPGYSVHEAVQDTFGVIPQACLRSACNDGLDNDLDGLVDLDDRGCHDVDDYSEESDCSDGIDNDGDGKVDAVHLNGRLPADPQCDFPTQAREDGECGLGFEIGLVVASLAPLRGARRRRL